MMRMAVVLLMAIATGNGVKTMAMDTPKERPAMQAGSEAVIYGLPLVLGEGAKAGIDMGEPLTARDLGAEGPYSPDS